MDRITRLGGRILLFFSNPRKVTILAFAILTLTIGCWVGLLTQIDWGAAGLFLAGICFYTAFWGCMMILHILVYRDRAMAAMDVVVSEMLTSEGGLMGMLKDAGLIEETGSLGVESSEAVETDR